jgi:hypothetical protein
MMCCRQDSSYRARLCQLPGGREKMIDYVTISVF